jgi:glycosyltransferase involved in cell wall biosynthesis
MKVLFIQKEGGIFGAEQFQLRTIPALIAKGIEIEFLRLYTTHQLGLNSPFVEKLEGLGVNTFQLKITNIPLPSQFFKMKKIIKEGNYDIIHTHLIHADFYMRIIKTYFNLPVKWLSTKHGYDNKFTAKYGFDASKQKYTPYFLISKWVENKVDGSFTISDGLLDFFQKTGMVKKNRMKRIHYGFDFDKVEVDPDGKSNFKIYQNQIFIAGRLIEFKGHKYLLEAISLLRNRFQDIGLVIAGTGDLDNELKQKVESLGIKSNVTFLGYNSEISKWMKSSDVVAVTSISEGFGVVFLEAFNSKTPVVSFDVPSGNELMVHKETGYLAKPYKSKHLAQNIEYILNNKTEASKVAERSYGKLKNYFNLHRMTDEIIEFYRSILAF